MQLDDHPAEELQKIEIYPTLNEAQEHALVILAMGEACWVSPVGDHTGHLLLAEPLAAPRIIPELAKYQIEQETTRCKKSAPPEVHTTTFSSGSIFYLVWALSLMWIFRLQNQSSAWVEKFASSSQGIFQFHEWWRPFTSLFLHADFVHLLGNILSAAFFFPFVSRALGPWRAWFLILACGTLGNALTAWLHYPTSYVSIGASTAVFAALGILAAVGFSQSVREVSQTSAMRMAAPLIAALVLLAWLGAGNESGNTDVMAHALGFGSGLVGGFSHSEIQHLVHHSSAHRASNS